MTLNAQIKDTITHNYLFYYYLYIIDILYNNYLYITMR